MNFPSFLRQLAGALLRGNQRPVKSQLSIQSKYLKRKVKVDLYWPPVFPGKPLRLLVCNDGQDLPRMDIEATMEAYYQRFPDHPFLLVGLEAGDRMREYGTAGKPDYKQRGDLAFAYEQFVIEELLPRLEKRFTLRPQATERAVAGFSLGGLNAFDLVWRNTGRFATAGVFSGALWWRSRPFRENDPDADRILHSYVAASEQRPDNFRCWFMAGTEDEEGDRNNNGIIDAIDDTLHLMHLLEEKGMQRPSELAYLEVEGGRHEPETWGKVMGDFLSWWVEFR
ncbi:esterase [Lewinellaceae bacterium SD302]|nr:esterase [Lewinellaceae bacterium SD302]